MRCALCVGCCVLCGIRCSAFGGVCGLIGVSCCLLVGVCCFFLCVVSWLSLGVWSSVIVVSCSFLL